MNTTSLINQIKNGEFDTALTRLYGADRVTSQRERYIEAINEFVSLYGEKDVELFSVPGRTEILGNHTDHNNGKVIAASVNIDIIAVASKTQESIIRVKSKGHNADCVDISNLDPSKFRKSSSGAIIAGVAKAFQNKGYAFGGFDAYTTSDVLTGSGLSSSAAFEVMIGCIQSHFCNGGAVSAVELAKAGQYAENVYFGKPCGLMDQTACALGGFAYIDFQSTEAPVVEKFTLDLESKGYTLCIINTGGNHSDLTPDYASVPAEMKAVAKTLGVETLRSTSREKLIENIEIIRQNHGDRAILRGLHFFAENERVMAQRSAIANDDIEKFLENTRASGNSSFKFLQNVYTVHNVEEQGISLALALCETLGVTARVHGGGFAGTVQAFPKTEQKQALRQVIESVFGEGNCMFLSVRPDGAVKVLK